MSKKASKKAYKSLPIKRKLEIINLVENLPPDKKKKGITAEFGIPASTLSMGWDSVTANAITNWFCKGGFTRLVEDECLSEVVVQEESEVIHVPEDDIVEDLSLIKVGQLGNTFEEYVCIDNMYSVLQCLILQT